MSPARKEGGLGPADVYFADERLQPLIGPGAPFEVEALVLEGVSLRAFVHAPRTIVDIFRMSVIHEALDHLVFEDERLTFAHVRGTALALAGELSSGLGVRKGDRVAIAMRNYPEFVMAFWGAALLGAIVVPLNSWWTGPELAYALADAGIRGRVRGRRATRAVGGQRRSTRRRCTTSESAEPIPLPSVASPSRT